MWVSMGTLSYQAELWQGIESERYYRTLCKSQNEETERNDLNLSLQIIEMLGVLM